MHNTVVANTMARTGWHTQWLAQADMHNTVVVDTMAFWGSVVDIHPTHDFGLSGLTEAEQKLQGSDPHYEPQKCPLEVRMDDLTHSHGNSRFFHTNQALDLRVPAVSSGCGAEL